MKLPFSRLAVLVVAGVVLPGLSSTSHARPGGEPPEVYTCLHNGVPYAYGVPFAACRALHDALLRYVYVDPKKPQGLTARKVHDEHCVITRIQG